MLQHDPEKHALGPRPVGWVPVYDKHALGLDPEVMLKQKDRAGWRFEELSSRSSGAVIPFGMAMDQRLRDWKLAVERFCSEETPDWHVIVRLIAAITATAENPTLRLASMYALPSLRNATARWPDRNAGEIAKRRLGIVLEVLNTLTTPRFGKRGVEIKPLTPDEGYRKLLGLPPDRYLAAPEIQRAFKRAAKTAHPDGGGSAQAFLELAAARDALMHSDSKTGG